MNAFLSVLQRRPLSPPPVWFMRQAGRFLPEYRALRKGHEFLDLCTDPALIAETTLMPVNLLDMDAAIFFSDILIFLPALGFGLEFKEGEGPKITKPSGWLDFKVLNPDRQMKSVLEGMRRTREALPDGKALIGFAGGPWTILSYLIEGSGSSEFRRDQNAALRRARTFHQSAEEDGRKRFALFAGAAGPRRPGGADFRHLGRPAFLPPF